MEKLMNRALVSHNPGPQVPGKRPISLIIFHLKFNRKISYWN